MLSDTGRGGYPTGCVIDTANQHTKFFNRIVDGVGDSAGDVLRYRRSHRQVAICEVAKFVHQTQNSILILTINQLAGLPALIGQLRLMAFIVEIHLSHHSEGSKSQNNQNNQRDDIPSFFCVIALIGLGQFVGRLQQRFTIKEYFRAGELSNNQAFHTTQNTVNSALILFEPHRDCFEQSFGFLIACRGYTQYLTAFSQCFLQILESTRILTQLKCEFRASFRAILQLVGALCDTLREHHELTSGGNLANAGPRSQLDGDNLLR